MRAISLNRWLTFFATVGLFISGQLWIAHSQRFSLPCRGSGCDEVARSPYSEVGGIPTATIGFAYFAGLILLSLSRLQNLEQWQRYGSLIRLLSTAGLLVFLYLTYLQFFVLRLSSPCWWCLSAAVSNLLVFLLAWAERRSGEPEESEDRELKRLGSFVVFALLASILFAGWQWNQATKVKAEVATAEKKQILLREGQGWQRGNPNAELIIVEFSDFECPACKDAYRYVEGELLKKHEQKLLFIFRHYPLTKIHPMAWTAATVAEEAGRQGKFWQMYHLLFQHQDRLDLSSILQLAAKLQLDQAKVRKVIEQDASFSKIYQDIEDGSKLGVQATPTFVVLFRDKLHVLPGQSGLRRLLRSDKEIASYLGLINLRN